MFRSLCLLGFKNGTNFDKLQHNGGIISLVYGTCRGEVVPTAFNTTVEAVSCDSINSKLTFIWFDFLYIHFLSTFSPFYQEIGFK